MRAFLFLQHPLEFYRLKSEEILCIEYPCIDCQSKASIARLRPGTHKRNTEGLTSLSKSFLPSINLDHLHQLNLKTLCIYLKQSERPTCIRYGKVSSHKSASVKFSRPGGTGTTTLLVVSLSLPLTRRVTMILVSVTHSLFSTIPSQSTKTPFR